MRLLPPSRTLLRTSPLRGLGLSVALAAFGSSCGGSGPRSSSESNDRTLYARAIQPTKDGQAERMEICAEITDPALRGDCTLAVASSVAIRSAELALAWCPQVSVDRLADECMFAAAESASMRGEHEVAPTLCARARSLSHSCSFHLFQLHWQRVDLAGTEDPLEASRLYEELVTLHKQSWAEDAAHHNRHHWYSRVVKAHQITDPAWCAPMTESHRTACEEAIQGGRRAHGPAAPQ